MKKRLLMAAFAVLAATTSFAFQVGDYATNFTQRFKITGENLVQNGNFANAREGWYGADNVTAASADVWDYVEGLGPNGEAVIQSIAPTAGQPFCNSWKIETSGTYIIAFDIKAESGQNLSSSYYDSSKDNLTIPGSNYADFFVNSTGLFERVKPTEEAPVSTVSGLTYINDEWKKVVYTFTAEAGQYICMHFESLAAGITFTNIEILPADQVYDIRIAQNRFALAKEMMENPNFNVPEAQEAKANLQAIIESIEGMIASGEMDDPSNAETMMEGFETEGLEPFLAVTSVGAESLIPGLNIASLSNWGRAGQYSANYKLALSGNWGHLNTEQDVLRSAIQNGFGHEATYKAFHEDFPAGKYFFTCEIRNANTGKAAWPTEPVFNLESTCKMFIGTDTIEIGPISGEDYQRFSMVADVKEDGGFYAGVYWPGVSSGGAFFIRNTIVRAFNTALKDNVEHVQAFKTYTTQWNAATSSRKAAHNLIDNANYPWGQNELKAEVDRLDPYYTTQRAKGWMTADGTDAGKASTDDLNDWALYQGIEEYTENEDGSQTRKEYQMVRGYQAAANTIQATNQIITDLGKAIDDAKKARNNGANATGDRDTYKTAILAAIATLKEVRSKTTDATRDADIVTLEGALQTLNAATEAFLASVTNAPIIDIDFANKAVLKTDEADNEFYAIAGNAGEMKFTAFQPDNTIADYMFAQGVGEELVDVLHVGGDSYGEVAIGEVSDNDILEIKFDLWYGQLGKAFQYIDLVNAAGTRVAGFSLDSYNSNVEYNDFDNAAGTGMVIKGKVKSNHDKSGGPASVCTAALTNSFTLNINYITGKLKGSFKNSSNTIDGDEIDIVTPEDGDNKIAFFRVGGRNHAKANSGAFGRRAWFDNLKISKFSLSGETEEDITESPWAETTEWEESGVKSLKADAINDGAIYTISGVRVANMSKPGMYIQNGKKFVIK